jgi:nucleotide-binding universal stress UspA family protein
VAKERIVVGVNGSRASSAALRWALEEAERLGRRVDAVYAWEAPLGANYARLERDIPGQRLEQGERLFRWVMAAAAGSPATVPITIDVREGAAGPMLTHAAAPGDLLVLGSADPLDVSPEFPRSSVLAYCRDHAIAHTVVVDSSGAHRLVLVADGGHD